MPTKSLKPSNQRRVSYLDSLRLRIFSQAQLIQLLGVGNPIVSYNRVGQGQDLASVAGVCQGLGIPTAGKQQNKCATILRCDEKHIIMLLTHVNCIHLRCKVVKLKIRLIFWIFFFFLIFDLCSTALFCLKSNVIWLMWACLLLTPPGQYWRPVPQLQRHHAQRKTLSSWCHPPRPGGLSGPWG